MHINELTTSSNQENYSHSCATVQLHTITDITYFNDDRDPEQLIELDNGILLDLKWYAGLFAKGQTLGLQFFNEGRKLHVTTFGRNGEISGGLDLYKLLGSLCYRE